MVKRLLLILVSLYFLFAAFISYIIAVILSTVSHGGEYAFNFVDLLIPLALLLIAVGIFLKKRLVGIVGSILSGIFSAICLIFVFSVQSGEAPLLIPWALVIINALISYYLWRTFQRSRSVSDLSEVT